MTSLKVAGLQLDVAWEDRATNYERVRKYAREARERGAELLVLPEMFATGFSLDPTVTAEPPDGETPTFLKTLAAELELAVVGGYVQHRRDGRGANTALAISAEGKQLAEYVKTHLFTMMQEEAVHEAGAGPRPFVLRGVETACFICYDLRFPELFRLVTAGAVLVIVIASWPSTRQAHWDTLLPARALENLAYVVGVNRVGRGGGHEYTGGSAIIHPFGETLAHAGDQERLIMAELDFDELGELRESTGFLRDRRF